MKLSGPLTIRTLFEFQDAARKETKRPVVVDLTTVPYMDSAGLGCVVSVFTSCQRSQRKFAIFGMCERISTLFEVSHLEGLLPTFPSIEAAISATAAK